MLVDGVDVRATGCAGYRHRLGVVPQEAHLFTGDVASNIAYGRPDATPAEIEAAARAVGALDLVRRAAGRVSARPSASAGRACRRGSASSSRWPAPSWSTPDLLLFDEATAALDPATEAAVLAAGDRVTSRRTAFVVAHRLATAARADRVVVLHGGRIVEQGPPAELLAQGGRFARLWQAGELEPAADDTGSDEDDLDGVNFSTRSA